MKSKSIRSAIWTLAAFSALTTSHFSLTCSAATYGNTTPFNSVSSHRPDIVLGVPVTIPEPLTLDSFGLMFGNPDYVLLRPSNATFGL
jgi:hypothetical protein